MTSRQPRPTAAQWTALEAVLEHGSQEAAARRLHTTERAVKLRLKRLREALRVSTTEQAAYIGQAQGRLAVRWLDKIAAP